MRNKSYVEPGETIKWCSKCQSEKPLDQFNKNRQRKDGLQNYCKECAYAAHRESLLRHKDKNYEHHRRWSRNRNLKHCYGITIEDFEMMIFEQNNKCAICQEEMTAPQVDHDHSCCEAGPACGTCVRALLCTNCNLGLGNFKDSPELLLRAVSYLDAYKQKGHLVGSPSEDEDEESA